MTTNNLTLFIYPKNEDVACLVLKSDNYFLRENHLFNYSKLISDLENMCDGVVANKIAYEQLTISDKRGNEYTMVCTFDSMDASLTVAKQPRKNMNLDFSWMGTVNAFLNAVYDMLKRLGRR